MDFTTAQWLNTPREYEVTEDRVRIVTQPRTDLWQRTFYGFRNDNAPSLLLESSENFTFTVRTQFDYRALFDQCGVAVYLDSENWFKASIEYENATLARLGSVVTNLGYSDWATTDIATPTQMWYRLSRRGPDFLIEHSTDGERFAQMRIFHLHALGTTEETAARLDPPPPPMQPVRFGIYACSPTDSSFEARFDHFALTACQWTAHRE